MVPLLPPGSRLRHHDIQDQVLVVILVRLLLAPPEALEQEPAYRHPEALPSQGLTDKRGDDRKVVAQVPIQPTYLGIGL